MWKWRWKFGSKNVEFLTNRMFASNSVSFQVWSTPRVMSASRKTICRTFVCVPYGTSKQNITARSRCLSRHLPYFQQQMPASFGSRGFILSVKRCHQGHQKVRPLSPVCRTCTRRIVQTWKRHGIRCKHSAGRNAHIFLQRIFHLHFHMKSRSVF